MKTKINIEEFSKHEEFRSEINKLKLEDLVIEGVEITEEILHDLNLIGLDTYTSISILLDGFEGINWEEEN